MDSTDIRQGEVLNGKYRVDRVAGEGGMGFVVAALHLGLDEPVALKFLHPECSRDELLVQRFRREARNAIKIKSDHVVRVMDVDSLPSGDPFMVMELLEGEDLAHVVAAEGALPATRAVDHILEACEALSFAHSMGIVHRDLKPSNLFLSKRADGSTCLKVLDFGISKALKGGLGESFCLTKKQEIFGSPMYMPPEQLESAADVDTRADIWSVGVILFELLTGSPPFQAKSLAMLCTRIMQGPTPSILEARPELPAALDEAVARCLKRERKERWQHISEFVQAIKPFSSKGTEPAVSPHGPEKVAVKLLVETMEPASSLTQPPPGGVSHDGIRRLKWLGATAAAVLVAGGVVAALAYRPGLPAPAEVVPVPQSEAVSAPTMPPAPPDSKLSDPTPHPTAPAASSAAPETPTAKGTSEPRLPPRSKPPSAAASTARPPTMDKGLDLFKDP